MKSEEVIEETNENNENNENNDIIIEKVDYKKLYEDTLAERNVYSEIPCGPEIDPILCDAFRIVSRFATQQQSQSDEQEFLWRSIYPKLPNGRPCYNPAGKYVVKLFLAGKWRRVVVNDVYPIDSNGTPAIASSLDLLELWPTILAKAVYTVYKSCGYDKTMPSLFPQLKKKSSQVFEKQGDEEIDSNVIEESVVQEEHVSLCPLLTAKYLGFCIYSLTGWQPSTPWSIRNILNSDINHFNNLIQEIMFGGAPLLEQHDKPGEILVADVVEEKKDGSSPTKMRTKIQLKEEYRKKLDERNTIVDKINARQNRIDRIAGLLSTPFSEVFSICVPDDNKDKNSLRILPVLGVCYPFNGKDNPDLDIRDVELLVEWTVVETAEEIAKRSDPSAVVSGHLTPYLAGLDQPLPPFTTIRYEWISIKDLALKHAFAFGFDTQIRLPHKSVMGWSWMAATAPVPVDDKAKGKDKKGAPEPVATGSLCDQGDPPPVLLSLDSAAFFTVNNENIDGRDDTNVETVEGENQIEMSANQTERPAYVAKQSHLSISVLVQADILEIENVVDGMGGLPSDVVIVLQELRDDDNEPIVMRVELSKYPSIPLTRQTFHIPAQKILPTKPLVFWVRLFTKSSVMIHFGSSVSSSFGKAETIYKDLGFNAVVQEGESQLLRPDVEQVLFRYPLSLKSTDDNDNNDNEKVFAFLNISNRDIASCVSMLVYSDEGSYSLPRTQGNIIPISSDASKNQMIVARIYHTKKDGDAPIPCPVFKWKLVVLSKKQISESIPLPLAVEQFYKGQYFPNNKLIMCKDILNVDKSTFPIALKFAILPNESNDNKGMRFIFRIYRVSDRKLIGEYRARTMMQLYYLKLSDFIDGEEEANGGAPPAGKKDDKGKGKAPAGPEGVPVLIEITIDESAMDIPNHWRSRLPFNFDNKISSELGLTKEEGGKSPRYEYSKSQFEWQLSILAGSVIGVQHDIYDLERYAANKNAWEDASEGRGDKSVAAVNYVIEKKKIKNEKDQKILTNDSEEKQESVDGVVASEEVSEPIPPSEPQPIIPDENLVMLLATALANDVNIIKQRETLILNTLEYKEYKNEVTIGIEPVLLQETDKENDKAQRDTIKATIDENSQIAITTFANYNTKLKEIIKMRIDSLLEDATTNSTTMASLWKNREDNKAYLEKKNNSLKWLLDRTKDALQQQQDAEDEASGKKPAKGKKK